MFQLAISDKPNVAFVLQILLLYMHCYKRKAQAKIQKRVGCYDFTKRLIGFRVFEDGFLDLIKFFLLHFQMCKNSCIKMSQSAVYVLLQKAISTFNSVGYMRLCKKSWVEFFLYSVVSTELMPPVHSNQSFTLMFLYIKRRSTVFIQYVY